MTTQVYTVVLHDWQMGFLDQLDEPYTVVAENTVTIETYETTMYDLFQEHGFVSVTPELPRYLGIEISRAGCKANIVFSSGYELLLPVLQKTHDNCPKSKTIVMFEDKKNRVIDFQVMALPQDWHPYVDHKYLESFEGELLFAHKNHVRFVNADAWFGS